MGDMLTGGGGALWNMTLKKKLSKRSVMLCIREGNFFFQAGNKKKGDKCSVVVGIPTILRRATMDNSEAPGASQ